MISSSESAGGPAIDTLDMAFTRRAALLKKVSAGKASRRDIEELQLDPESNALLPPLLQRRVAPPPAAPEAPKKQGRPKRPVKRPLDRFMWRRRARGYLRAKYGQWLDLRDRAPSMQWSRDNIRLPASISPQRPGAYDPDAYPSSSILYEFFDSDYEEFIGVKSSQSGFTQAAFNLICLIIEYQLGNVMFVMDSAENVKAKCVEALIPMIKEACKSIGEFIPEDDDKLKSLVLNLLGVRINLAGAKSAGKLASRTLPVVIGDEVDEWPTELQGGESNALDLLRDRCKLLAGTGRKKLMVFSKPRNALTPEQSDEVQSRKKKRVKEDGIIWQEAMTGTRHRCHVPCQHCGELDYLRWEQVRFHHCRTHDNDAWDYEAMQRDTYYECRLCKGHTRESDQKDGVPVKEWMIKRRKWIATNLGQDTDKPIPGKMSALTDDLLATDPGSTWGCLAVEFVTARTTSQRRKFRRSRLGLPVQERVVAKQKVAELVRLAGHYPRGHAPEAVIAACTIVDVQEHGDLFRWQHIGFDLHDNVYMLNHGDTPIAEELERVMKMEIPVVDATGEPTGKIIKAPVGWIDEGDGQCNHLILDLCVLPQFYGRLTTVKGRGYSQVEAMGDRVALQKNRVHKNKNLDRYLIDGNYFLDDLYELRIQPWVDYLLAISEGKRADMPTGPRIYWPRDPDHDVLLEYTTEQKTWHLRRGKMIFGWPEKQTGGKNDHSDISKYGLAWWYRAKPLVIAALKRKADQEARVAAAAAETASKPK